MHATGVGGEIGLRAATIRTGGLAAEPMYAAQIKLKQALTIALFAAPILLAIAALGGGQRAAAQSAADRVEAIEEQLEEVGSKEGVLTTTVAKYNDKIAALRSEIATLRNKEAVVQAELERLEADLDDAVTRLQILRARLRRAISVLEDRLVEIYKSSDPDLITVVLESNGFSDLLERSEYLQRIEDMDSAVVTRVRELRDQMQATVTRIRAARDRVAAKKRELEQTRSTLESRNAELASARSSQQAALAAVQEQRKELEGDLSEASAQVEKELSGISGPLPAGPIQGGSYGFIWPVNGPITSGFGYRWGRMHEGVDIGASSGTPIRAAKSGTIVLASAYGGYGNYTCISHGGGLSTCYAHQSRFARTSGSIGQGSILGYVGCTGHCFGDHLHFEVRINGVATDPMNYL